MEVTKYKTVRSVRTHDRMDIPGYLQVNLKTVDKQSAPGIEMHLHPYGVWCQIKGEDILIPWVMIRGIVMEKSDEAIKVAKGPSISKENPPTEVSAKSKAGR
jgi:hypothetical protein